jgi:hypothetical protein
MTWMRSAGPAEGDGAIAQGVLTLRAFAVFGDLSQRRLAHIEIGVARELACRDLAVSHRHARPPSEQ